jgi:hypothetical protein
MDSKKRCDTLKAISLCLNFSKHLYLLRFAESINLAYFLNLLCPL